MPLFFDEIAACFVNLAECFADLANGAGQVWIDAVLTIYGSNSVPGSEPERVFGLPAPTCVRDNEDQTFYPNNELELP